MRVLPCCALLLCCVVLAACGDPPPEVTQPPSGVLDVGELEPGPVIQGLSISARLDAQRGLIRYEVENAGEQPFRYARGHLDHVLEVRREDSDSSIHLAPRPEAIRFLSGTGPTAKDVRELQPGETLPRDAFLVYSDQRRFTPEGQARPGLEVPPAGEAFTLDLLDFVWPAALGDLDDGVLLLRVVQVYPDWSELLTEPVWSGRLPSAELELDLGEIPAVVRDELDRGGS